MNIAELDAAVSTLSVKSGLTPTRIVLPRDGDLADQIGYAIRKGLVHKSSWVLNCTRVIGKSDRVYVRWEWRGL